MQNGELFKKIMANSPGGLIFTSVKGKPPIFISSGIQDTIFPIATVRSQVLYPFNGAFYFFQCLIALLFLPSQFA